MIKELMKIRVHKAGIDWYLWPFVAISLFANVLLIIDLVRLYGLV